MGKKNRKFKKMQLMLNWPSDNVCPSYDYLLNPLKKVLYEGYNLERKQVSSFVYMGYTIGDAEQIYFPTPAERFSSRWILNDQKFNRTLIDNILVTALHFGMEYGRRLEKFDKTSPELLESIIKAQSNELRQLRKKLNKYEDGTNIGDVPIVNQDSDLIISNPESDSGHVDIQLSKEE